MIIIEDYIIVTCKCGFEQQYWTKTPLKDGYETCTKCKEKYDDQTKYEHDAVHMF